MGQWTFGESDPEKSHLALDLSESGQESEGRDF
jgi:hypothetical protein